MAGRPKSRRNADRHYNRQTIGADQFVPPGGCLVLITPEASALWVTSTPFAEFVKHAWPGAWVCSCFRNEAPHLDRSSDLIIEALAATRASLGEPPPQGLITFVDPSKTRHKRDPGRCFLRAGFRRVGMTKGGLVALLIESGSFPAASSPIGLQLGLYA